MDSLKVFQRLTIGLILLLAIAFFFAAYSAINNIVAEQSRIQQSAVSPVYKLVRDELLRPLYIAETFASSIGFMTVLDSHEIDEALMLLRLRKMEQDLDLEFFVASERTRKQYFSSGRVIDLIEGDVWWYFEAIEEDRDVMADLGQVGDVHLFFDVKMYNQHREFVGYVGVGKRIKRFLDTFDEYKAQYGYDFLFVNEKNEVILSSIPDLVVTDAYIPTLESLAWFEEESLARNSLDSELIHVDGQDLLVSEFGIEELDWQLLLLVPLKDRQAQITRSFATNALASIIIVALLAATALYLMLLYKRSLEKKTEVDALTGLPNRAHLERRFNQMRRAKLELCVILVDLDHFKQINDSYGHQAGDVVIREAANALKEGLREMDIVGRWGGEEFVMLIPAVSISLGAALAERAREAIDALEIAVEDKTLSVRASFGVSFGAATSYGLDDLVSHADEALYEAKHNGRNQVKLYTGR